MERIDTNIHIIKAHLTVWMAECYFYMYDLVQVFPKSKKKYQIFLKSEQKMYLFEVIPMVGILSDNNRIILNGSNETKQTVKLGTIDWVALQFLITEKCDNFISHLVLLLYNPAVFRIRNSSWSWLHFSEI